MKECVFFNFTPVVFDFSLFFEGPVKLNKPPNNEFDAYFGGYESIIC